MASRENSKRLTQDRGSTILHPVSINEGHMPVDWGVITVKEVLHPVGGTLISGIPETVLAGISTDSRTLQEGDLFWALRGDTFDGHDFVPKAMEKGASGVVVCEDWVASDWRGNDLSSHRTQFSNRAVISVEEPLQALGDLAAWWRRQHRVHVVGITGSSGKTTTKEMAAAILEVGNRTLKTQGNFNNLIGLPLTLLRLTRDHECAVLEMGMNRPGEIARLTHIADPDVGVIINVGMAHLEGLLNLDGVARAKTELIERISSKGLMILNGDDVPLMQRASLFSKPKMTFGLGKENDVTAAHIKNDGAEGTRFSLTYRGNAWPVHVKAPGIHNVKNALAAAAIALSLNEPPEHIIEGLGALSPIRGRFEVISLKGGVILVDDTYNANPSSLGAALESIGSLVKQGGRIIVGLGEMLELGDAATPAHKEAGQKVVEGGAHWFFAMGDHARDMIESARTAGMPVGRMKAVATHQEMTREIGGVMAEGDLIFLKGSRKMQLEKVVEGLRRRSHGV